MENKYQIALEDIKNEHFLEYSNNKGFARRIDTLQELIDKTTICGLSLDEAIPVIEVYKQLKYTTHQIEPIQDLMMGTKGQFYINGKSLQELIDKETPKKPIIQPSDSDFREYIVGRCPICKTIVYDSENRKDLYCHHCGQRLDWSVYE